MIIAFKRTALLAALMPSFISAGYAAPTYDASFNANIWPSPYQTIAMSSDGGYFLHSGEELYGSPEDMPCAPLFADEINVPGYDQLFNVFFHPLYTTIKLNEQGRMDCDFSIWAASSTPIVLPDGRGKIYGVGGRARLQLYDTFDGYYLWESPYHIARFFETDGRLDGTVQLGDYPQQGEFAGNFIPFSTLGLSDNRTYTVALDDNAPFQRLVMGGMHQTGSTEDYYNIWRLNSDGSPDASFHTVRLNAPAEGHLAQINKIVVQPSGKILVGGAFHNVDGVRSGNFIRLNADGTLDTAFLETMRANRASSLVDGEAVNDFFVQPDGKIIVAGNLQFVAGDIMRFRLLRFHPDGSFDHSFTPPWFISETPWHVTSVNTLALQSDGKIIVTLSASPYSAFADDTPLLRLNADGTLDETFQIRFTSRTTSPATVSAAVFDHQCRLMVAFEGGWEALRPIVEFPLTGETTPPVPGLVRLLVEDSPGCIH